MKPLFLLVLAFSVGSSASYAGTNVDAAVFIARVAGAYTIQTAGGVVPHEENSLADVFADTTEGAFTLPYCDPAGSFCDPGYLFFGYKVTTVTEEVLADGSVEDQIVLDDSGKKKTFTWTASTSGTITFRNEQYSLNGKTIVLEHVMVKKN
jgi:hypothetical protein